MSQVTRELLYGLHVQNEEKLTLMVATAWSSSSSGQRTNWRGRSSPAAYPMRSRAVSLVWRRELTKTSTGLMGECAWKPQSQAQIMCMLPRALCC